MKKLRFTTSFLAIRANIRKNRVNKIRSIIDAGGTIDEQLFETVHIASGGKESKRHGSKCNKYDLCVTSSLAKEDKSYYTVWEALEELHENPDFDGLLHAFGEYLLLLAYDIDSMDEYNDDVQDAKLNLIREMREISKERGTVPNLLDLADYIKAMGINEDVKYYDRSLEKNRPNMGMTNSILTTLSFISTLLGYTPLSNTFDMFNKRRGTAPLPFHNLYTDFGQFIPEGVVARAEA